MSKILPVVFNIVPKPCSMEEVHHLGKYFEKFGNLLDLNYKPSNIGKLSIQYPNKYYAFYEVKKPVVEDLIKKLHDVKGIPRLEYNRHSMNHKDETLQDTQQTFDLINKEVFEKIDRFDYSRHFFVSCNIKKFIDLTNDNVRKDIKETNKYIADNSTQGYFSTAFGASNEDKS